MITFAHPLEIKLPKGGLILEEKEPQDHILGGLIGGPEWKIIRPDGRWTKTPTAELQKNRFGDTYFCVSFSKNSADEFLSLEQFNEALNKSDVFLGVGSGTRRGYGNSKRTVAEWDRLNGFLYEPEYPYLDDMTLDQVYTPLSSTLLKKGLERLFLYEKGYKWLDGNTPKHLLGGLQYSPLQVDIEGQYIFSKDGYVINGGQQYLHEVLIFNYEEGKCWHIFDSESLQFLKFDWNYKFGNPMIHLLKKKMSMTTFYKGTDKKIYLKGLKTGLFRHITSGAIFQDIWGDYKNYIYTTLPENAQFGVDIGEINDTAGWSDEELNSITQCNS